VAIGGLLWVTIRARRTDSTRAATILWGSWLVATGLVFSFAAGIIHPYYNVVLAPAIGGLIGIGGVRLWQSRDRLHSRLILASAVALTGVWAYDLLDRTPDWQPWLRYLVLILAAASALAIVGLPYLRPRRSVVGAVAIVAFAAVLAAPIAYSAETASTPHTGAIPSAGPGGRFGGPGGRMGNFRAFGARGPNGVAPNGNGANRSGTFRTIPGLQGGSPNRGGGNGGSGGFPGTPQAGSMPSAGSGFGFSGNGVRGNGGLGGLLDSNAPSKQLVSLLKANAGKYRWVAATVGANSAAGVQIASGEPILAIGGFNGSDPTPTLAQFKQYVKAGQIHYYLANDRGGGGFGGTDASRSSIQSWVAAHFKSRTVGGVTVYDLTSPKSRTAQNSQSGTSE
jgi:4-amino-4-deoxy-L-arabinose transferase-like glycosyltransferase